MNEFRNRILGGDGDSSASLLRVKTAKGGSSRTADEESFDGLTIPRATSRGAANHRDGDRHFLNGNSVRLVTSDSELEVTLVNLSGGGAMVEGAPELKLWDHVELVIGDLHRLEAVVRWLKNGRAGLEFAHETRIDADQVAVDGLLREVIERSFSDVVAAEQDVETVESELAPGATAEALDQPGPPPRELRHPLIWSATIHFNHQSTPVRLRNISAGGALIESDQCLPVGAELLLDMDEAGAVFGTVHWAAGDQTGIKFATAYNLSHLSRAKPQIAGAQWTPPDYLRDDRSANSPWASQWGRADLGRLHRFLKR